MTSFWSGDDWESYCHELLAARHGPDYQRVPDTVAGDWGIEGYVPHASQGHLYQCYAAEEPLSTSELYEKQRKKMTADISKLKANLPDVASLLVPAKVSRWVLLVPRVEDKQILVHASNKAAQIRKLCDPAVSDDFSIRVHTADDFPTERRLIGDGQRLPMPEPVFDDGMPLLDPGISTEELDVKLGKLATVAGPGVIDSLRREFLVRHVRGSQVDRNLRQFHPVPWERWNHARRSLENSLTIDQHTNPAPPHERMSVLEERLAEHARTSVPGIGLVHSEELARGTVAGWLVDCPLDFA